MKKIFLLVLLLALCCTHALVAAAPRTLLTDDMYARATAFAGGDVSRLMHVMQRANAGEDITLGVIGGSITQGTNISAPAYAYANRMLDWWRAQFPAATFTLINAGIGATDSYLGVHRVQRDLLDHAPDLVVVEFSVNDLSTAFYKKSYENLVRRILLAENMPAVLLLFMTQENGNSAQEQHANIGFRYALPMISYRNAVLAEVESGRIAWRELASDHIHPNDRGHALISALLTRYFAALYENIDVGMAVPAPFSSPPVERQAYPNARIENARSIAPASQGAVTVGDYEARFPDGWRCTDGSSLVFTVECANIGLLYLRTTDGASGLFDVIVDGVSIRSLDGDFTGGWGDYAAATEVYASKDAAFHTIEIRPQGAHMVTLLGLLIS